MYAYDLLYRSGLENSTGDVNRTVASSRLIVDTFIEIGIDAIVGTHRAFLNIDQSFLIDPDLLSVAAEKVVLQIPADIEPTGEVVDGIDRLSSLGYQFALNNYRRDLPMAELLDRVKMVEIDAMAIDDEGLAVELESLGDRPLLRIAKRVETAERRDRLAELGFDCFQGHYFAKPEVVTGQRLPSNRMAILELVTKVCDPEIDGEELANLIALDPSLSVRILRYVNSPISGVSQEVDSIQHAVVMLGREVIKGWVMLLALAGLDNTIPELITTAFVRAKVCERLAAGARLSGKESFFTVGLFSLMDAVMSAPMPDLLETLPFSPDIKAALTENTGTRGEAIRCAQQLEQARVEEASFQDLDEAQITEIYLDSIRWADQMTAGVG